MQKIYKVTLTAADETENGKVSDSDIAKQFHCHRNTVANIRERFVEDGLDAALHPIFFQPLGNWRRVSVRERRTQKDFA